MRARILLKIPEPFLFFELFRSFGGAVLDVTLVVQSVGTILLKPSY